MGRRGFFFFFFTLIVLSWEEENKNPNPSVTTLKTESECDFKLWTHFPVSKSHPFFFFFFFLNELFSFLGLSFMNGFYSWVQYEFYCWVWVLWMGFIVWFYSNGTIKVNKKKKKNENENENEPKTKEKKVSILNGKSGNYLIWMK